MNCDRCAAAIPDSEARPFRGGMVCEDCYMDLLSPPKACDPWAVYSATSFSTAAGQATEVTQRQAAILTLLEATGGAEPGPSAVDRGPHAGSPAEGGTVKFGSTAERVNGK